MRRISSLYVVFTLIMWSPQSYACTPLNDWCFSDSSCCSGYCAWFSGAIFKCLCDNKCNSGAMKCNGTTQSICQSDSEGCLDWYSITQCANGCNASTGECNPTCTTTCPYKNDKRCNGSYSGYEVCNDYNGDTCLEWGGGASCQYGCDMQTDSCKSKPPCTSTCFSDGLTKCSGDALLTCGDYNNDTCLEWDGGYSCTKGCYNNKCKSCSNECSSNQTGCSNSKTQTWSCSFNSSTGCMEKEYSNCSSGTSCTNGSCLSTCTTTCPYTGDQRCNGSYSGYEVCNDYNGDTCLEWGGGASCQYGCNMQTDNCNAAPQCTSTCLLANSTQCSGSTQLICNYYNGEICLTWGGGIECAYGCNTSTLKCNPCSNECSTAGVTTCSNNLFKTCGNFDNDTCLEWDTGISCTCFGNQCKTCTDECTANAVGCDNNASWTCTYNVSTGCNVKISKPCPPQTSCNDSKCQSFCVSDCKQAKISECVNSTSIASCGNFDSDPCLELGTPTVCEYGCDTSKNVCKSPPNCVSECTVKGATNCQNTTSLATCIDSNGKGCLKWSTSNCAKGCVAISGIAQCKNCVDTCGSNLPGCKNENTIQLCLADPATTCLSIKEIACKKGDVCKNGNCEKICTESWKCSPWSECIDSISTRTCDDAYACGTSLSKPDTTKWCSNPPCAFPKVYWETTKKKDAEAATLIIENNGSCNGKKFHVQIWEYDYIFFDEEEDVNNFSTIEWTVSGQITQVNWPAVYRYDGTDLFQVVNAIEDLHNPEYYAKIFVGNSFTATASSKNNPYLVVTPYYQKMTYEEFSQKLAVEVKKHEAEERSIEFSKCITPTTITDRCREMFKDAHVEPFSETITDLGSSLSYWLKHSFDFLDPGNLLIIGLGCVSCGAQNMTGAVYFEATDWKLANFFGDAFYDTAFSYPFGLTGPKACELCGSGIWEAMDNAVLLAYSLLEMGFKAFIAKTGEELGTSIMYATGDNALGMRMTYTTDAPYVRQTTLAIENNGLLKVHDVIYKNPIVLYGDGAGYKFVKFNALENGRFVVKEGELTSPNKKLFIEAYQNGLELHYSKMMSYLKMLDEDIYQSLSIQLEQKPIAGTKNTYLGSYSPESTTSRVNVAYPYNEKFPEISYSEGLVSTMDHELGHAIQHAGIKFVGYDIVKVPGTDNQALEYFNDRFCMEFCADTAMYYKKMNALIHQNTDVPIKKLAEELIGEHLQAVASNNYFVEYRLPRVYAYADELGYTEMTNAISNGFNGLPPQDWIDFSGKVKNMQNAASLFNKELASGKPSKAIMPKIIETYHLNEWGTLAGETENTTTIQIVDGSDITNSTPPTYLDCVGNEIWSMNATNEVPIEHKGTCPSETLCEHGVCVGGIAEPPPVPAQFAPPSIISVSIVDMWKGISITLLVLYQDTDTAFENLVVTVADQFSVMDIGRFEPFVSEDPNVYATAFQITLGCDANPWETRKLIVTVSDGHTSVFAKSSYMFTENPTCDKNHNGCASTPQNNHQTRHSFVPFILLLLLFSVAKMHSKRS